MSDTLTRATQLRHERAMDNQFIAEHAALGKRVGEIVMRYGVGPNRIVPNLQRTRIEIKTAVWKQSLKPYYIGAGDDPFSGASPNSQFAKLLYDGIAGSVRIQVERQVDIIKKATRNDEMVYQWLTGPRSQTPILEVRQNTYDPFHTFVSPDGYTLSQNVWRNSQDVRSRIDALLDYHIPLGTSAVDIAEEITRFLTPGAAGMRTNAPYGVEGSFAARRLARTEITAAAGRATVNASKANPFVDEIKWSRSNSYQSKKPCDICKERATGGKEGDGVYEVDKVPPYPAHPHEMCVLSPMVNKSSSDLVAELRRDIQAANPRAQALKGAFNVSWLANAMLNSSVEQIVAAIRGVPI